MPNGDSGTSKNEDGSSDAGAATPWGQILPKASMPLADTRGGRRVVASRSADGSVLVDWFDAGGSKSRAATLASTAALEITAVRLDDAGNLYASMLHTAGVDINGEREVQQAAGSQQCTVLRLEASTGAVAWQRNFAVPGAAAKLRCSVRRVLDGNVLVIAGFGGGALTTRPGTLTLAAGGRYDGLVTTLGADTGAHIYTRQFKGESPGEASDIELRDAHFTSPTTVAVVGSTSSKSVDLGDGKKLAFTPMATLGVQSAGLLVRLDLLTATNNAGELWPVTHPTESELYESTMTLQSVTGSGNQLAVVGSCYATTGGSVAEFGGIEPLQLGNHPAVFAFGIGATRHLLTQTGADIDFFTETFIRVGQADDGRVTLVGFSQPGLALGGPCDRAPRDQPTTYAASFTDASLTTCTALREYKGSTPTEVAGTGDSFVLSAETTVPVSFDGFDAPAGQAVAVELTH